MFSSEEIVQFLLMLAFLSVPWLWHLSKKISEQKFQTHDEGELTSAESDVEGVFPYEYTQTTSGVLKKHLPEVMRCPECKQPVLLTADERTHQMFVCPHCGYAYQESSAAVSASAGHPIAYTFVDEELREKLESVSRSVLPPLPERVHCMHCNAALNLSFEERSARRFTCPSCRKTNDATHARFDNRAQRWLDGYTLKPFVVCPNCNAELQLEQRERMSGEFVCPECNRRSEFTRDTAATLSQFFLTRHPICPECSHENTLTSDDQVKGAFVCSGCKEVMQYVEE